MGNCFAKEQLDFDGPIDFQHFEILRAIGKGAFGKVCIVKKKDTKQMYAMKYMNKVQIIEKRAVDNVFREIHILKSLDHPFIVNVWFAFQDEEDIFLVLDLMLGGDISYHLEKEGCFDVTRVRLYMAEICLALDYLADKGIIHRDLKPANMLLDSKGHVHLTDFNVATIQRPNRIITSTTGTKPYMAPEVVKPPQGGYSNAVDWWSLGVSAYEMLRGERPYVLNHHMSNTEVYELLMTHRPPASYRWEESTCNVLKVLLHTKPSSRLSTLEQAKAHPFFETINWDNVLNTDTKPVYIPSQNRIHCDPTHELEEMIVEPNPLHKKKSRLSKRRANEVAKVQDELEKINEKFQIYNRMKDSILKVSSQDDTQSVHTQSILENSTDHKDSKDHTRANGGGTNGDSPVAVTVHVYDEDSSIIEQPKQPITEDPKKTTPTDHTHSDLTSSGPSSEPQSDKQPLEPHTSNKTSPKPATTSSDPSTNKTSPDHVNMSPTPHTDLISPDLENTSSGTYNPKDSDSIVPLHVTDSCNASLEGEVGFVAEVGMAKTEEGGDTVTLDGIIIGSDKSHKVVMETDVTTKDGGQEKNSSNSCDSDTRELIV